MSVESTSTSAVTVTIAALSIVDDQLSVLLVERVEPTGATSWGLPGGPKRPDETLDEAATRELMETAGVPAPRHLDRLNAYEDHGRGSSNNGLRVAYFTVVTALDDVRPRAEAVNARVWPVSLALHARTTLALVDRQILADAVERARSELERSSLATAFIAPTFSIGQLRSVYEVIWDTVLDPANFRRSVIASETPYVEATGSLAAPGLDGGRPPTLYRTARTWRDGAPVRRPRKSAAGHFETEDETAAPTPTKGEI